MSRHRSISTDLSTDPKLADLFEQSTLAPLLYTWAIPHADDWGRLTGDARQFKLLVCPACPVPVADLDATIALIASVGLWQRYEVGGRQCLAFPAEAWFRHQNYIQTAKRRADRSRYPAPPNGADPRNSPTIPAIPQEFPQKCASPTPTPTEEEEIQDGKYTDAPVGASLTASDPAHVPEAVETVVLDPPHPNGTLKQSATQTAARRDPLWDALVAAMRGAKPETATERGAWNAAAKQLRDARASPEQIQERADRYRARYPRSSLTPLALARHWGELAVVDVEAQATGPPLNGKPAKRTVADEVGAFLQQEIANAARASGGLTESQCAVLSLEPGDDGDAYRLRRGIN